MIYDPIRRPLRRAIGLGIMRSMQPSLSLDFVRQVYIVEPING